MFNSQYFNSVVNSSEQRKAFAVRFNLKHDEHPKKYGQLMRRMLKYYKELHAETAALLVTMHESPSETRAEAITNHSTKASKLAGMSTLITLIKDQIDQHGSNRWAWVFIRLDFDKCLGTVKNLSRLRSFMSEATNYDDSDDIESYLRSRLDVFKCHDCGDWEYESRSCETYNDDTICRECAENNYRYSDRYENYVHCDYAREAIDQHGNRCVIEEDDSSFEWNEDDDIYEHIDYHREPEILGGYHASKRMQRVIHDEWSDKRDRWLGVELEVEIRSDQASRTDKAVQLNDLINDSVVGKRVFFETDGSLNNGIEIISQPMSLPAHRDLWKWLTNSDAVKAMRSHNTTTCGLHVHVTRSSMTQDQIAKMVLFVNDRGNEALIKAIARRYAEGYCRIKEKTLADAHYSSDRYEAINITSDKTVEFRIFKGSLKYESVIAAIEFANALTDFTRIAAPTVQDLTTERFMNFIETDMATETETLRPYINNRLELA